MELLTYLLTGAIVGLMAGLLGVGGGLLIVPILAWLFARHGFASDTLMHYAVGTSLAVILPTSLASLLTHQRLGSINWQVARLMAPGILLGALLGAVNGIQGWPAPWVDNLLHPPPDIQQILPGHDG